VANYVPKYGASEKKQRARRISIIEAYRDLSGKQVLPEDLDYVTLCGPMSQEGKLLPNCELIQVLKEGLISSPAQFHGIEKEPAIHRENQLAVAVRFSKPAPHLYKGELSDVLDDNLHRQHFRPGIVHVDLLAAPKAAVRTMARVLSSLDHFSWPMLIVWNVIIARGYPSRLDFRDNLKAVDAFLGNDERLRRLFEMEYPGTSNRSATTMRSFILWRAP
jgi:hypothetical protein